MIRAALPVLNPRTPANVPTHDNTMLRAYARCERLYAVMHVLGWRPLRISLAGEEQPKSRALMFGAMFHEGLAAFYRTLKETGKLENALYEGLVAIHNYPYDEPIDPEEFRTKGRAKHDLQKYAIHYKGDRHWKILMTETPSGVEDKEGYRYGGRMDLAVIATMHGVERMFPVDHKTTTRFSKYFYDNFKLDPQMHGYNWMAEQLTGMESPGAIVNTIILHKKKTEFDRNGDKPLLFYKGHIARWRDRNIARFERISAQRAADPDGLRWHDQSIWNPSYEHCVDRYGQCPMFKVCHGHPENAETHLNILFEPGRWDFAAIDDDD